MNIIWKEDLSMPVTVFDYYNGGKSIWSGYRETQIVFDSIQKARKKMMDTLFTEKQEKILIDIVKNFVHDIREELKEDNNEHPVTVDIAERVGIMILMSQLKLFYCKQCDTTFESMPIHISPRIQGVYYYDINENTLKSGEHYTCPDCNSSKFVVPYYHKRLNELHEELLQNYMDIEFSKELILKQKEYIEPLMQTLQEHGYNHSSPETIPAYINGMMKHMTSIRKSFMCFIIPFI